MRVEVKGGVQATIRFAVEVEGHDRTACVVDTISRFISEHDTRPAKELPGYKEIMESTSGLIPMPPKKDRTPL